ncbi:MAG: hypothetical protein ACOYB4_00250 [Methyloceanibacter sp.]
MPWFQRQAAFWIATAFLFVVGAEHLHAATSAGAAGQPEMAAPQGSEDPPDVDNSLPEPLPPSEHKGVIQPPDIGDEDIYTEVPDPDAGHEKEVIPPSGLPEQMPETKTR